MRMQGSMGVLVAMLMVGGVRAAAAEDRPIEQLPNDVVHWSMLWVEVPKAMMTVGVEHGPLAALTWGPIKGTAAVVESTTKELWKTLKRDEDHPRKGRALAREGDPKGPIFRYEF